MDLPVGAADPEDLVVGDGPGPGVVEVGGADRVAELVGVSQGGAEGVAGRPSGQPRVRVLVAQPLRRVGVSLPQQCGDLFVPVHRWRLPRESRVDLIVRW